jgi:hypothetical protein
MILRLSSAPPADLPGIMRLDSSRQCPVFQKKSYSRKKRTIYFDSLFSRRMPRHCAVSFSVQTAPCLIGSSTTRTISHTHPAIQSPGPDHSSQRGCVAAKACRACTERRVQVLPNQAPSRPQLTSNSKASKQVGIFFGVQVNSQNSTFPLSRCKKSLWLTGFKSTSLQSI